MFSKACEYGIKATIYIAKQSLDGKISNLKEISKAIHSPESFTAKILQQLVKASIIISVKGASGGFKIDTDSLSTLSISRIVTSIDSDALFHSCGLGLKECSDRNPCPMHSKYKVVRKDIVAMLKNSLVIDLVKKVKDKKATLRL